MRTPLTTALLIATAVIAHAQVGSATAGQVSTQVFTGLTAPANSPGLRNIGQTNHVLYVAAPGATTAVAGIQCRIEASVNGTTWVPVSNDIVYLPALGSGPTVYAMVKANGVYPYLRVGCPVANSSHPVDVHYIGSQFPYGDLALAGDRYLTTSVGSTAAALAAPPPPTSLPGIQPGLAATQFISYLAAAHTSVTLSGATIVYATSTSDTELSAVEANNKNSFYVTAPWNRVSLAFGAWTANDHWRTQALVIGSSAGSQPQIWFSLTKEDTDTGNYHILITFVPNCNGCSISDFTAYGSNPYGNGAVPYAGIAFGPTPPASLTLQAAFASNTLTFQYSIDSGASWIPVASFDRYAFDHGYYWTWSQAENSAHAVWDRIGFGGGIAGGATAPDSFTITQFRYF
jgi:hypothetical protein